MTTQSIHSPEGCQQMLDDVQVRAQAAFRDLAIRHGRAQALADEAAGCLLCGLGEVRDRCDALYPLANIGSGYRIEWIKSYRATARQCAAYQAARRAYEEAKEQVRLLEDQITALREELVEATTAVQAAYETTLDALEPLAADTDVPPTDEEQALPTDPDSYADYPF